MYNTFSSRGFLSFVAILYTFMNMRTNTEKIGSTRSKINKYVSMFILVVEDFFVGVQDPFLHAQLCTKRTQLGAESWRR